MGNKKDPFEEDFNLDGEEKDKDDDDDEETDKDGW